MLEVEVGQRGPPGQNPREEEDVQSIEHVCGKLE
jgi:hypothetical protein